MIGLIVIALAFHPNIYQIVFQVIFAVMEIHARLYVHLILKAEALYCKKQVTIHVLTMYLLYVVLVLLVHVANTLQKN